MRWPQYLPALIDRHRLLRCGFQGTAGTLEDGSATTTAFWEFVGVSFFTVSLVLVVYLFAPFVLLLRRFPSRVHILSLYARFSLPLELQHHELVVSSRVTFRSAFLSSS